MPNFDDPFEDAFRRQLGENSGFKVNPPDGLWDKIQNDLPGKPKPYLKSALILVLLLSSSALFLNKNEISSHFTLWKQSGFSPFANGFQGNPTLLFTRLADSIKESFSPSFWKSLQDIGLFQGQTPSNSNPSHPSPLNNSINFITENSSVSTLPQTNFSYPLSYTAQNTSCQEQHNALEKKIKKAFSNCDYSTLDTVRKVANKRTKKPFRPEGQNFFSFGFGVASFRQQAPENNIDILAQTIGNGGIKDRLFFNMGAGRLFHLSNKMAFRTGAEVQYLQTNVSFTRISDQSTQLSQTEMTDNNTLQGVANSPTISEEASRKQAYLRTFAGFEYGLGSTNKVKLSADLGYQMRVLNSTTLTVNNEEISRENNFENPLSNSDVDFTVGIVVSQQIGKNLNLDLAPSIRTYVNPSFNYSPSLGYRNTLPQIGLRLRGLGY